MKAFITGSRAYGVPTDESDIDLIVVVEASTLLLLSTLADNSGSGMEEATERGGASLRFGRLNLLCVTEKHHEIWKRATDELREKAPVTRDVAVAHIKAALDRT